MSRSKTNGAFKYDAFPEQTSAELQALVHSIKRHSQLSVKALFTIGDGLARAKLQLEHGSFAEWVNLECGFSLRTAERYMKAAAAFLGKTDTVSHLQPSTVYRMSAKTVQPAMREEILARIENEPSISDVKVNDLLDEHLQAIRQPRTNVQEAEDTPDHSPSELSDAWQSAAPSARLSFVSQYQAEIAALLSNLTHQGARFSESHERTMSSFSNAFAFPSALDDVAAESP